MIYLLKKKFREAVNLLGFDIIKKRSPNILNSSVPPDFNSFHKSIIDRVKSYTVTSNERLYATIESTRYILKKQIHGSFVECGVYKGGSMMAVALTLLSEGVSDRDL
ncbi:MAG: TylF/MycF/NovP-related O-methyltransferase, partial [Snowella sp.]|nr:TylF/MycF/NovP-related O-methyltransferase [Snowella sp.]